MKYLNLGCGNRFHPDWTNVNFVSTGNNVIAHNLTKGIPFPDESFDLVYHSHVLEHFSKVDGEIFLKECHRVLKKEGILRLAVPDLEQIAKIYLTAMEKALEGSEYWEANYEWILLEMYDQTVRNTNSGDMGNYLVQEKIINEDFLIERGGVDLIQTRELIRQLKKVKQKKEAKQDSPPSLRKKLRDFYGFLRSKSYRQEVLEEKKESLIKYLLGDEYKSLEIGRFRQSGEIHQWMYDRYSLSFILKKLGFEQIVKRSATESYLQNWTQFNLDTEPNGTIYKPDSLYMEAIKI